MQPSALFIHRDGTLVKAYPDSLHDDTLERLVFLPGVIRNLYFIRKELDFRLVLVTRPDATEADARSPESFNRMQAKMLEILAGEGIVFDEMWEDGLTGDYNMANSFVIGNCESDIQLAVNLGCKCILTGMSEMIPINVERPPDGIIQPPDGIATPEKGLYSCDSWEQVKELLFAGERQASVRRTTNETDIFVWMNLEGSGLCDISTGIGFFNHLLEQIGKHGGLDLTVKVKGDLHVDEHHTIEDTAIALGEAVCQALGDKRGIERYGFCLPMDDCLCSVALDFGGRSWIDWKVAFKREKIGDLPTEMIFHFFKSLSDAAKMNLHIQAEGENEHHKAEGIFKAFARAVKAAVKRDVYKYDLPTTKGVL